MNKIQLFILIVLACGCSGQKRIVSETEAYDHALAMVTKMKKKPRNHKKWEKLSSVYNESVQRLKNEIAIETKQNNSFKWNNIAMYMVCVNSLSDSLRTIPGCCHCVDSLFYYAKELEFAKKQAAQEFLLQARNLEQYNGNVLATKMALLYLQKAYKLDPSIDGLLQEIDTVRVVFESLESGQ